MVVPYSRSGWLLDLFKNVGLTAVVPSASDLEGMLRDVGLRVTKPRVAVLTAVYDHPHADTDSLREATRQQLPTVSHQTVYDVLRALSVAGLLRRIEPAGSVARYEARVGDNHHHLVCRSCGDIVDVDCAVGETPCLTASEDHGYEIDEAEVVYWGQCPRCAASDEPLPTSQQDSTVPSTSRDMTKGPT
jgi:Fur family ferric uptake transcriptional regulator